MLTIIGALNWGLYSLFHFDVVAQLTGGASEPLARLIYLIIGVAGIVNLGMLFGEWQGRERKKERSPRLEEQ